MVNRARGVSPERPSRVLPTTLNLPSTRYANQREKSTDLDTRINVSTVATAGFAGLLVAVLKSGGVKGMITSIIQTALSL